MQRRYGDGMSHVAVVMYPESSDVCLSVCRRRGVDGDGDGDAVYYYTAARPVKG